MTNVTNDDCDKRYDSLLRRSFIMFGGLTAFLTVILSVFLWMASVAITRSDAATRKVQEVSEDFGSHASAQVVEYRHIRESIEEIKRDVRILRNGTKIE